jgi:hypothetical protein
VSQNADTIRQGVESFNAFMRGELSSEALAAELDPQLEVIWADQQTYPDFPQHLRGLAEVIAVIEQFRDGWIDLVQELLELIDAPGGRVLGLVQQSGRGRQSGVPAHHPLLRAVTRSETEECARSSISVIAPILSKQPG